MHNSGSRDDEAILQEPAAARLNEVLLRFSGGRAAVVLDLGCGRGAKLPLLAQLLRPGGLLIALDLRRDGLRGLPAAAICADAQRLPLADASVELAWAVALFGQLADAAAAWRELARVVRPGGRLVTVQAVQRWVRLRRLPAGMAWQPGGSLTPADGLADGLIASVGPAWRVEQTAALVLDEELPAEALSDEQQLAQRYGSAAIVTDEPEIRPLALISAWQRAAG